MALITKRIIDLALRGHTLPLGLVLHVVTVVGLVSRKGKVLVVMSGIVSICALIAKLLLTKHCTVEN